MAILMIFVCIQCSIHTMITEESDFSPKERPKSDEGIAVFHFLSENKMPLPSEVSFKMYGKKSKTLHFVISALSPKKTAKRYVFLKKGTYSFTRMIYRIDGAKVVEYFPQNFFTISSSYINYIGDIVFLYNRTGLKKIVVQDKIDEAWYDFYKKYPDIIVKYQKKKSLIKIQDTETLFDVKE